MRDAPDPWPSIPAMLRDARRRDHPDRRGGRDRHRTASPTPSSRRAVDGRRAGAAWRRASSRGDRVAVWAPNSTEWIVAALGVTTAGGVLVPVNTRFKGTEAAYVLARSDARRALHGARVPRHRLSRRCSPTPGVDAPRARATRSSCPAPTATARSAGPSSSRAATPSPTPTLDARVAAIGPDDPSDVVFTSGTTGQPEGRRDDARPDAARLPRLVRLGRPARRRPLPDRQSVLPHLRVQGRRARVADARRDDLPARGVRPGVGARASSSASGSPCSRARRRCTSRCSTIPTARGTTSRACGSR